MDKIKIKRIKKNTKTISTREKILAGLGLGTTLIGGAAAAASSPKTAMVSSQESVSSSGATVKSELGRIFGNIAGIPTAKADVAEGPEFITTTLPTATAGQPYTAEIVAQSTGSLAFSTDSSLPGWLKVDSSGSKAKLTGTPPASVPAGGVYIFNLTATDGNGVENSGQFLISVNSGSNTVDTKAVSGTANTASVVKSTTVNPQAKVVSPTKASTQSLNQNTMYTVKKGDTLWGISQKFYGTGTKWRSILSANPRSLSIAGNVKTLKIGAQLSIPDLAGKVSAQTQSLGQQSKSTPDYTETLANNYNIESARAVSK